MFRQIGNFLCVRVEGRLFICLWDFPLRGSFGRGALFPLSCSESDLEVDKVLLVADDDDDDEDDDD